MGAPLLMYPGRMAQYIASSRAPPGPPPDNGEQQNVHTGSPFSSFTVRIRVRLRTLGAPFTIVAQWVRGHLVGKGFYRHCP
eukprot:1468516-Rhodomonas_salina.2